MRTFAFSFVCILWIASDTSAYILKSTMNTSESDEKAIHCYCNLPSCITTSYMCKSETNENGCFKKFDATTRQIHCGCLDQSIKSQCPVIRVDTAASLFLDEVHPFHCCYSDMCNNEASDKQFSTIPSTSIHINESDEEKLKEILSVKNVNYRISPSSSSYVNTDTWFRAIMIAVPILGLMILVKLVEVAFRLLKSDTSEEKRSTAKLVNQSYNVLADNNTKLSLTSIPGTRSYRSYLLPKCSVFDTTFFFVFRQQDKSQNTKNAKYICVSPDQESNNNCALKEAERFSKQNLNILKLPRKFNELKDKNSKNDNFCGNNSNNCYNLINSVTSNSNSLNIKRI